MWDYAAAAPYLDIDMAADPSDPLSYKDAVVLSPHKFVGGPGTPGVLAIRRELLTNSVPVVVGGGTVAYVNPAEHVYLSDPVHREEAGTPAIVESIRAGLVFDLKRNVGIDVIRAHEEDYLRRAITAWQQAANEDELKAAGSQFQLAIAENLPTIPLVVRNSVWVARPNVRGWLPHQYDIYPHYNDVWLAQ